MNPDTVVCHHKMEGFPFVVNIKSCFSIGHMAVRTVLFGYLGLIAVAFLMAAETPSLKEIASIGLIFMNVMTACTS